MDNRKIVSGNIGVEFGLLSSSKYDEKAVKTKDMDHLI